jgi:hypothetical protein
MIVPLWARVTLVCVTALVVTAGAHAQEYVQVEGTVQWLSGQTLTLVLDVPAGPPTYVIQGPYVVALASPRQIVNVDVSRLSQSDYAFVRSGDRVSVVGTLSTDRRRIIAVSLTRGSEQQNP